MAGYQFLVLVCESSSVPCQEGHDASKEMRTLRPRESCGTFAFRLGVGPILLVEPVSEPDLDLLTDLDIAKFPPTILMEPDKGPFYTWTDVTNRFSLLFLTLEYA